MNRERDYGFLPTPKLTKKKMEKIKLKRVEKNIYKVYIKGSYNGLNMKFGNYIYAGKIKYDNFMKIHLFKTKFLASYGNQSLKKISIILKHKDKEVENFTVK